VPDVTLIGKDRSFAAKRYRDWNALVDGWRAEVEAIGRSFASGDARADPKRGPMTCANCDQPVFCRIAEKAPFSVGRAEDEDD